ncbi:MAG: glycosyltransferase family 2 protein [Lachnospiraceae bacterium]|nr:glycosyltransferase family 2 protein [Candidatus Colinaster equi]
MDDKLYIVMPAYNEEENIESVVKAWYECLACACDGSKLVIADNGSTDRTHEILTELKNNYPALEILGDTNRYHGPKLIALYKYAIAEGATYIFQTDSDGQTNPDEFLAFWDMRDNYDAIIGSRPIRGDGLSRKMVEKVLCVILHFFYGINISDANAPFRLMSAKLLGKYIDRFDDLYNLPNAMLTTFFVYYKENILFKDVTFMPRQAGKSSINIKRIFAIGWKALSDFSRFKKNM